jgi:hypothetical protein
MRTSTIPRTLNSIKTISSLKIHLIFRTPPWTKAPHKSIRWPTSAHIDIAFDARPPTAQESSAPFSGAIQSLGEHAPVRWASDSRRLGAATMAVSRAAAATPAALLLAAGLLLCQAQGALNFLLNVCVCLVFVLFFVCGGDGNLFTACHPRWWKIGAAQLES